MTLEEAIKNREDCLKYLEGIGRKASPECLEAVRWSVKALKALRPVSREQVEKVWKGEWKHYLPPLGAGDVQCRCTRCGMTPDAETPFCAWCGAPMTDEAVDIRLEELEALHD